VRGWWAWFPGAGSDDDPVEVSDMDDPEEENMGKDLSDGDGDGGFLLVAAINAALPLVDCLMSGDSEFVNEEEVM